MDRDSAVLTAAAEILESHRGREILSSRLTDEGEAEIVTRNAAGVVERVVLSERKMRSYDHVISLLAHALRGTIRDVVNLGRGELFVVESPRLEASGAIFAESASFLVIGRDGLSQRSPFVVGNPAAALGGLRDLRMHVRGEQLIATARDLGFSLEVDLSILWTGLGGIVGADLGLGGSLIFVRSGVVEITGGRSGEERSMLTYDFGAVRGAVELDGGTVYFVTEDGMFSHMGAWKAETVPGGGSPSGAAARVVSAPNPSTNGGALPLVPVWDELLEELSVDSPAILVRPDLRSELLITHDGEVFERSAEPPIGYVVAVSPADARGFYRRGRISDLEVAFTSRTSPCPPTSCDFVAVSTEWNARGWVARLGEVYLLQFAAPGHGAIVAIGEPYDGVVDAAMRISDDEMFFLFLSARGARRFRDVLPAAFSAAVLAAGAIEAGDASG